MRNSALPEVGAHKTLYIALGLLEMHRHRYPKKIRNRMRKVVTSARNFAEGATGTKVSVKEVREVLQLTLEQIIVADGKEESGI